MLRQTAASKSQCSLAVTGGSVMGGNGMDPRGWR